MGEAEAEISRKPVKLGRPLGAHVGDWCVAMFGALGLGVGLPVFLVTYSYGWNSMYAPLRGETPQAMDLSARGSEFCGLMFTGLVLCSPGTFLLGSILLRISASDAQAGAAWNKVFLSSVRLGALLSFLNLPGYLSIGFLQGEMVLKLAVLFLVAGVAAGAWISRVAWRVAHPRDSFLPAFSLAQLLGGVVLWAAVMALFMPK